MVKSSFNDKSGSTDAPQLSSTLGFGVLMSETTIEQLSLKVVESLKEFGKDDAIIMFNMDEISPELKEKILNPTDETIAPGTNRKLVREMYSHIRAIVPDELDASIIESISLQTKDAASMAKGQAEKSQASQAIYDDEGRYSFGIVFTAHEKVDEFAWGMTGIPLEYFDQEKMAYSEQADQFLSALHEISHNKFMAKYPEEYRTKLEKIDGVLSREDSENSHSLYLEIDADKHAIQYYLENAEKIGLPIEFAKTWERARALAAVHQNYNYTTNIANVSLKLDVVLPSHVTSSAYDVVENRIVEDQEKVNLPKMSEAILTINQLSDSLIGKQFFEQFKEYEDQYLAGIQDDPNFRPDPKEFGILAEAFEKFAVAGGTQEYLPASDLEYADLGDKISTSRPDAKYGAIQKLSVSGVFANYAAKTENPHIASYVDEYLEAAKAIAPKMTEAPLAQVMKNSHLAVPGPRVLEAYLQKNDMNADGTAGIFAAPLTVQPTIAPIALSPAPAL